MDRLQSLRAFQKVVDEGGFAAAARALDMAPAGVTAPFVEHEPATDPWGTWLSAYQRERVLPRAAPSHQSVPTQPVASPEPKPTHHGR